MQPAQRYYEQSVLLREASDTFAEIRTRARLGFLLQDIGDPAGARAQYAEATRLGQLHGITTFEAILLGYRGNTERAEGRCDEAIATYDEAIARLRVIGDRRYEATFTMDRGIAHLLRGSHADALMDLEACAAIWDEIAATTLLAIDLGYLVVARAYARDFAGARQAEEQRRRRAPSSPCGTTVHSVPADAQIAALAAFAGALMVGHRRRRRSSVAH